MNESKLIAAYDRAAREFADLPNSEKDAALAFGRFAFALGADSVALENGEAVSVADKWQAVARNLAQVLNEAALMAANNAHPGAAEHWRSAFARQCEAHGVKP